MTPPRSSPPPLPSLKSPAEVAALREAGRVNAQAHRLAGAMIRPGAIPREIDLAIAAFLRTAGAEPLFLGIPGYSGAPYPAVSCISVNEGVAHGIPGARPLRTGDVVSVDLGCRYHGWCADSAESHVVGAGRAAARRLVETTRAALDLAISETARCQRWSDVVARLEPFVAASGLRLVDVVFGHGIGREMHEPPQVPFCRHPTGLEFIDFDLRPGLVFTIEPVLTTGAGTVRLGDDQWTIVTSDGQPAAHCEHAIAITEQGVLVLTRD